mmetsp:Transcript_21565/g.59899  ORF Transcript_21565/g.59899 Transcript_21565/m.59899 type:complete len:298 (-) Transcript_21565:93-986(-)
MGQSVLLAADRFLEQVGQCGRHLKGGQPPAGGNPGIFRQLYPQPQLVAISISIVIVISIARRQALLQLGSVQFREKVRRSFVECIPRVGRRRPDHQNGPVGQLGPPLSGGPIVVVPGPAGDHHRGSHQARRVPEDLVQGVSVQPRAAEGSERPGHQEPGYQDPIRDNESEQGPQRRIGICSCSCSCSCISSFCISIHIHICICICIHICIHICSGICCVWTTGDICVCVCSCIIWEMVRMPACRKNDQHHDVGGAPGKDPQENRSFPSVSPPRTGCAIRLPCREPAPTAAAAPDTPL